MLAVLILLSAAMSTSVGPTAEIRGTNICHGTGAHGNHGRGSKRLNDPQEDQCAIVGWNGGQENICGNVNGNRNEVERPTTLPIRKSGPKQRLEIDIVSQNALI